MNIFQQPIYGSIPLQYAENTGVPFSGRFRKAAPYDPAPSPVNVNPTLPGAFRHSAQGRMPYGMKAYGTGINIFHP